MINPEANEQCDGGTGCTSSCTCNAGTNYEPYPIPQVNCRRSNIRFQNMLTGTVCGNGIINTGEQCDGGTGCTTSCTCNSGANYEPQTPSATNCQRSTFLVKTY